MAPNKTDKINETILIDKLRARFGGAIEETVVSRGEVTHVIKEGALQDVCMFVKNDSDLMMKFLSDVVGVDLLPAKPRFEVVYHMLSVARAHRLRLKVRLSDDNEPTVPSVTGIWRSASCAEREAYDMFGIVFKGHPDLRRIYLAQDWEGFPLRKDYPLKGYKDDYNPFGEEKK